MFLLVHFLILLIILFLPGCSPYKTFPWYMYDYNGDRIEGPELPREQVALLSLDQQLKIVWVDNAPFVLHGCGNYVYRSLEPTPGTYSIAFAIDDCDAMGESSGSFDPLSWVWVRITIQANHKYCATIIITVTATEYVDYWTEKIEGYWSAKVTDCGTLSQRKQKKRNARTYNPREKTQ